MNTIKLLGACCNYGQSRYGPRLAPYHMENRFTTVIEKVKEKTDTNIFDYDKLYYTHNKHLNMNKNIITIGGDHSISYSTVNSALQKYGDSLHVIWIDAHADINTQSTSKTHNLHGMPVGHLMGFENHPIATFENRILHPSQITYIGIREIDPPEQERIKRNHIRNYNSFYSTRIFKLADYLKEILINKKIYISLDLDSLDPKFFPCTGTRTLNGLYLSEVIYIINSLKEYAVGMDIVEFDPLVNKLYAPICIEHIATIIQNYSK